MATFKGVAFVEGPQGPLGGRRRMCVSLTTSHDPTVENDHANFEFDATTGGITFVFKMTATGTDPPVAPNLVDIDLFDATSATSVDTVQLSNPADGATGTLNVTSDGTGAGTPLIGDLRLRIRARKTDGAGGVGNYDVNSDTTPKRGVVRVNPTTLSLAESATPGGSPRTWPDSQQATFTHSHGTKTNVAARNYTVTARKADLSATYKTGTTNSSSGTTQTLGSAFSVNFDYPQDVTSVVIQSVVAVSSLPPDSDATFTWIQMPSGSGQFVDTKTLRTAAFNVDPRVTMFNNDGTTQGGERTSAQVVVNFSRPGVTYHTINGRFRLKNARSEAVTDTVAVKSRDVAGGTDESTISASLSPSGGLYTLPAYTYVGPNQVANRGTGTAGDTAAHTTSGKAKTLKAEITGSGSGASQVIVVGSGTFVSLSDLLRGSPHPQKSATLVKDADPLADPGSAEDTQFTISEDVLNLFAFVGDVNGVGRGAVDVTFQYFDVNNNQANSSDIVRTSQSAPDLGWTTSPAVFDVKAPAGAWKGRIIVDVDALGSGGNFLLGASNPSNVAGLDQTINFLSAFTANKNVSIGFGPVTGVANTLGYPTHTVPGDHARPGDRLLLGVAFFVNGIRTAPDTSPTPSFLLARFNLATSKAEVLQSDFTWKDKDAVGYADNFFDFKQGLENIGGIPSIYVASFGTAGQGVTGSNGYVIDTAPWGPMQVFIVVKLSYNTQAFRDDELGIVAGPSPQHPFGDASLPEAKISFDPTSGHDHDGSNAKASFRLFDPTGLFK